jgi:hypothetical protein
MCTGTKYPCEHAGIYVRMSVCVYLCFYVLCIMSNSRGSSVSTGTLLRAGRQGLFLFATASRSALWSIQPPIQWVPENYFPGDRANGVWIWPLTSIYCRGYECVDIYLHSPDVFMGCWLVKCITRLHGVVLRDKNYLTLTDSNSWLLEN